MVPFCPGWFTRVPTTASVSVGFVGMVPLAATKVVAVKLGVLVEVDTVDRNCPV